MTGNSDNRWKLLEMGRGFWKWIKNGWIWMKKSRNVGKWLEIAGKLGNLLTRSGIALHDRKLLEIAGTSWNACKWL